MNCPVCDKLYTRDNWKSRHHILPRRFFNGEGELFTLCRNCHNKIEKIIPIYQKLSEQEYYQILFNFIKRS